MTSVASGGRRRRPAAAAAAAAAAGADEDRPRATTDQALDHCAPPLSSLLHPDAFRRVYGDLRDGERPEHVFEQVDYEDEKKTVTLARMPDSYFDLRARANIMARRRKRLHQQLVPAPPPPSRSSSPAPAGRHNKRKHSSLTDGYGNPTSEEDDGVDERRPPKPIPLDPLRRRSPSPARPAAAAASSSSAAAVVPPEEEAISPEELKEEILRMRKNEEGLVTPGDIWAMHKRDEELRNEVLRERTRLQERAQTLSAEQAAERKLHLERYAATPYLDAVDALIGTMRDRENDKRKRRRIASMKSVAARQAALGSMATSTRVNPGEVLYKMLGENLDLIATANKIEYSQMQWLLLTSFSQACAPLVYDKHWNGGAAHAFLLRNKLREHNPFTLAMAPRRFGKTWAVVCSVLALAMTQTNLKIVVFSQNARTSEALIAKIRKFLSALKLMPAWADRFPSRDRTKVVVIPLQVPIPPGTKPQKLLGPEFQGSTIRALPCTVDGMPPSLSLSLSLATAWCHDDDDTTERYTQVCTARAHDTTIQATRRPRGRSHPPPLPHPFPFPASSSFSSPRPCGAWPTAHHRRRRCPHHS